MRQGQIGTTEQRRMIFIWEGCLASLPDNKTICALEKIDCRAHQWRMALDRWKVNPFVLKWIWSVFIRTELRVDVCVTTRPSRFAKALAHKIEMENWPVRYVFAIPADELGRRLPTMPDVERVCYGLEEQRWAFGPQGYLLVPEKGQLV